MFAFLVGWALNSSSPGSVLAVVALWWCCLSVIVPVALERIEKKKHLLVIHPAWLMIVNQIMMLSVNHFTGRLFLLSDISVSVDVEPVAC